MPRRRPPATKAVPPGRRLFKQRAALCSLAEKHGMRNVRVFGSIARGEDRPGSDVDLLVEVDPRRGLYDLIHFEDEVERLMKCDVDVVTVDALSPYLRERILSEARSL